MEKPVLVIEAPNLSDEAVTSVQRFLHEMMVAFESHYYQRLKIHERNLSSHVLDDLNNDQDPF